MRRAVPVCTILLRDITLYAPLDRRVEYSALRSVSHINCQALNQRSRKTAVSKLNVLATNNNIVFLKGGILERHPHALEFAPNTLIASLLGEIDEDR